jgi:hypothetical protein
MQSGEYDLEYSRWENTPEALIQGFEGSLG